MIRFTKVVTILLISFFLLPVGHGRAAEPQMPDVQGILGPDEELRISEVARLTPKEAFKKLKGVEFLVDEKLLHKAIYVTYKDRKAEGLDLALHHLLMPQREVINGKVVDRTAAFYVSKKFFEVFPEESVSELLKLYDKGDGMVQGNVVQASGKISGGEIRQLLVKALDNKKRSEEKNPEMLGFPLRVCDEAYNQLVLRYKVRGTLRTIGNGFNPEVRDYHIDILKKKIDEPRAPQS
jgi:hypothetical protein